MSGGPPRHGAQQTHRQQNSGRDPGFPLRSGAQKTGQQKHEDTPHTIPGPGWQGQKTGRGLPQSHSSGGAGCMGTFTVVSPWKQT